MERTIDEKDLMELKKWAKYGKLFSGIIHNLNSPIMGVSGRLELIAFRQPDLKGLDKITTQLNKINEILSSIAFLVEKDMNNNIREMDIKNVMINIDKLFFANMKYKHKMSIETNFENSFMITTKPASLINSVTNIIEEVVEKCDEDTKMTLSYSKQDNYLMISVAVNQSFIVDENGFNFNLAKKFANQISADIFCENNFSDTLVIIKIPLN
jgi:signal transduction histidine kinase